MMRFVLFLSAASLFAADLPPKVIRGGKVEEILWLRLDKGDLMLESIRDFARENNVRDGAVLTAVGGIEECRFHGVNGTMTEVKEAVELLNLNGLIADSEPHLHVVVSNKAKGAFGGHLEDGCKVLSQVEITLAKFAGPPITRKPAPGGTKALRRK